MSGKVQVVSAVLCSSLLLACPGAGGGGGDGDGTTPSPSHPLTSSFEHGSLTHTRSPRAGFGGLKVRLTEERQYVLEGQRDETGASSRRLVVSARSGAELWRLDESAGEHFTDFTLHPSGAVSLGVERTSGEPLGYGVVRVAADGTASPWQPLPQGETLPASDLGGNLDRYPFQLRSWAPDALTDAWLRLEARGEDLVVAFLSLARMPGGDSTSDVASGVMALTWREEQYHEAWTRVVDGRHAAGAVAWAYDEFRWRDAAVRPLLSVTADGRAVVGRTWTQKRCEAVAGTFHEFDRVQDCILSEDAAPLLEVEKQPFAFTVFSSEGAREGTRLLSASRFDEFVVFAMEVDGDGLAVAGTVVQPAPDGSRRYYPAEPGGEAIMTPYDGYLAMVDLNTGVPRFERVVDAGRGDCFAALRVTPEGLLAAGAADWDRWYGGMSISRGADPLLAFAPRDSEQVLVSRLEVEDASRHYHLLGVDARGGEVVGVGLSEAPMTHTGDYAHPETLTFGGLTVDLR